MKKVICLLAANGSGKTTLIKLLLAKYRHYVVKVFDDERWEVIRKPGSRMNASIDNRALIVGEYEGFKIGGADRLRTRGFWKGMKIAADYRGAGVIIVEALKLSVPDFHQQLQRFCDERGFELHNVYIKADLMTCYERHVKRGVRAATYPLETVMMRHTRAKYLFACLPKERKYTIENMGNPEVAADKLLNIVFRRTSESRG